MPLAPLPPADGLVDPSAVMRFVRTNILKAFVLAVMLCAALLGAFALVPFPYRSTAIVLVDPRQQFVTPTQDVLPAIGTDTATLESVVQIVQSGGFLARLLQNLDVSSDPELAKAAAIDPREMLATFRKNLTVARRGATYLVDIAYTAKDSERAATYANAVAQAFVDEQNNARTGAAEKAAGSLSARLGELRLKLRASEDAAARFKASAGIVDIDATSTLVQREISELTQQIALAKTRAGQARARFEHLQGGASNGTGGEGGDVPSTELTLLHREQAELLRVMAQLKRTLGDRHPRMLALQSQLDALAGQIRQEEERVGRLLKQQVDVAQQELGASEASLGSLVDEASRTAQAQVQLADLERQAAADRAIYEQYLARFKATDEQKLLAVEDVRIVSAATPPLRSTRPSWFLAGAVFAISSAGMVLVGLLMRGGLRPPPPPVRRRYA